MEETSVRKNRNEMDMTNGNLFVKILKVALPLMLTGVLQLFYNAADLIVCGSFGSEHAVAAISATNSLINLIVQLFLGFSVGASVLMARCFGSQDAEKGSRVSHTAMLLSLIIGCIIGAFGMIFSGTFLELMKTPEDVIQLSKLYLIIYFAGLPFSMVYNFGAALLRATGDTKRPFYFLTASGIINIGLNLLLVIVFRMDVAGVAIATVASQAVSATLIVLCLLRGKGFCQLRWKSLRLHAAEVREIIRVGLPAGLQGAIFSLSNVLIQSSVNSLGTYVMDGNGASSSLEGFVYTCMNSIAQTCIAFVSANYGARNVSNMKKSIRISCCYVLLFGVTLGGIVTLFGRQLLSIYLRNETSIFDGYQRLQVICLTYFLCGLMDTFAYSLRGIGYSFLPTIVSLCGACGLRILWVFTVFPIEKFHNIRWLSLSYPVSWLVTTLVLFICYMALRKRVYQKLSSLASVPETAD